MPGVAVIQDSRRAAIGAFKQDGLPHRRIEAWKYTDLRNQMKTAFHPAGDSTSSASWQALTIALGPFADLDAARIVLVDGVYAADLSALDTLGDGARVLPLSEALADECFAEMHDGRLEIEQDYSVIALNTAFMTDGAAIHLTATPKRPIHIINVARGIDERMIATRNVICVSDGVEVAIVESFVALEDAATQTNALTHIGIGAGARVEHIKVQREGAASTHLSTWIVEVGAEADYRGFQYSAGAALARNQISVRYIGENAKADISGAYLLAGRQHCDTTLVVEHPELNCISRELFKAVLDDEARGVFQGKVIVRAEAQKTDG
ncbi:MAG TPA: SufD family Fe-S cluster assembly protein, partial [Hyphomicrobiaceae bacterium]|nr:SufD family Fe-S cluster assembly protein [Hyphomicrobiaceae bacterium]